MTINVPELSTPMSFDLETIPHPMMMDNLAEVKQNKGLVDEDKIAADIAKKKMKQLDDMALNGTTALIVCCSFAALTKDGEIWSDVLMLDPDANTSTRISYAECEFLEEMYEVLAHATDFISFNGKAYDLPIMARRCLICNVIPTVNITQRKFLTPPSGNHYDMLEILSHAGGMSCGSLDYVSEVVLGETKAGGISGKDVAVYWNEGKYDEIKEYAEQDAILPLKLWDRAKGIYWEDNSTYGISDGYEDIDTDEI